ncbi:hypothetical protein CPC08DRAFT_108317 [Agrocybe pediades]|nr:hypothetical protein CPC08DRAFT_108317 [Agrocybe pediades]
MRTYLAEFSFHSFSLSPIPIPIDVLLIFIFMIYIMILHSLLFLSGIDSVIISFHRFQYQRPPHLYTRNSRISISIISIINIIQHYYLSTHNHHRRRHSPLLLTCICFQLLYRLD